MDRVYYEISNLTWINLQREIRDFVHKYDGEANIQTPESIKIDFYILRQKLRSTQPVNFVSYE